MKLTDQIIEKSKSSISQQGMIPPCTGQGPVAPATRRLAYFATLALMTLLIALSVIHPAYAEDLLVGGKEVVNDTFGQDSTFSKWLILGEAVVALLIYIKTKNMMVLAGVVVVIVFLNIVFGLVA